MSKIVNFEIAKLAKEKGFNVEVINQFNKNGDLNTSENSFSLSWDWNTDVLVNLPINVSNSPYYSAPTLDELKTWLREKYHLYVRIATNSLECHFPMIELVTIDGAQGKGPRYLVIYKTYNEALENGLLEALKIL